VNTKRTSCKEKKAAEKKGDNTDSESPGAEGTTDSNPGRINLFCIYRRLFEPNFSF
jgi:hypothetical protein